ncbi:hypothetical protein DL96DRAFT_1459810 [Flagelloscypha sp. PMI_526]|nr:hypothetical protein DL96DRAFT_1459810 [Flagelloscypha sp. PMI_526]
MSHLPESDVSRRSGLPTHKLVQRGNLNSQGTTNDEDATDSKAYLDKVEKEWCDRIDNEIEVLVEGMVDIVGIASVHKFRIALDSYQTQTRAESMVRAANSLLSITHSLQLMLLLSDESQIAQRRDDELTAVRKESLETKAEVAKLLDSLLRQRSDITTSNTTQTAETSGT